MYSSLFALFNVKSRFSSRDYIEVLQRIATECQTSLASIDHNDHASKNRNYDSSDSAGSNYSSSIV